MARHGYRSPGFPIILLIANLLRTDNIPPVTLLSILGQLVIFLRLDFVYKLFYIPSIKEVCISALHVYYRQEWIRLILAPFFHLDDWHLYYNMVSFLWKGITCERRLGSLYFAYLLLVFSVLTSAATVGLAILAEHIFQDSAYISQCAAGFSGVLFALKVLTTYWQPNGTVYIMGMIPVFSRYAFWAELVIIQLLVPNASFIGHLAGILVGLAYIKGPLKYIMDLPVPAEPSYTYTYSQTTGSRRNRTFQQNDFTTGDTQTTHQTYSNEELRSQRLRRFDYD